LAYTFDPPPRSIMLPDRPCFQIEPLEMRIERLLKRVDYVVVETFSREFASHEPSWFAQEVLQHRLRARGVVVGWDFRFGRDRVGTADMLQQLVDIPVRQIGALRDGDVISSSRIRRLIATGSVEQAGELLGRPCRFQGEVIRGDQIGRTIGFPTANIAIAAGVMRPAHGVYAGRLDDGHPVVVNVGTRPTVDGADERFEVHLLDTTRDLYGQTLHVDLLARLRDERRFDGLDALKAQISEDVAAAKAIL